LRRAWSNTVEILRQQEWLTPLEANDLARVARVCKPRSWTASNIIFQRGDDGHEVILVCSGRIRLSVSSVDGRELSLRYAGPGSWLGEIAVLCGTKRTADATTVADVEALIISRRDVDKLMDERPAIAKAVARHLCDLLRATTGRLESVVFLSLGARLARFLLELATFESRSTEKEIFLEIPYSRAEIAEFIGASRPKVSSAFSRLEKMRAIRRVSSGYICNIECLQNVAEAQGGVLHC
jgi:CRP-like cAMP-binding protein